MDIYYAKLGITRSKVNKLPHETLRLEHEWSELERLQLFGMRDALGNC